MAPLNGMLADDFNNDGNLDILVCGNDYGNEVSAGRYDAVNGLLLAGDGKGNFSAETMLQSGIFINGDAKALIRLQGQGGNYLVAASQNSGPLQLYSLQKNNGTLLKVNNDDRYALLQLKNGKTRKQEFYYGTSFLSQSAKGVHANAAVNTVTVVNNKGEERKISWQP